MLSMRAERGGRGHISAPERERETFFNKRKKIYVFCIFQKHLRIHPAEVILYFYDVIHHISLILDAEIKIQYKSRDNDSITNTTSHCKNMQIQKYQCNALVFLYLHIFVLKDIDSTSISSSHFNLEQLQSVFRADAGL